MTCTQQYKCPAHISRLPKNGMNSIDFKQEISYNSDYMAVFRVSLEKLYSELCSLEKIADKYFQDMLHLAETNKEKIE